MQRNNKDNEMNPNKEERLNDTQNQENQEDGIRRKRKRVTYKHRLQLRNSQVQQEQNLERTEDRESRRNSIKFVNVNSSISQGMNTILLRRRIITRIIRIIPS